ncbi:MAG: DUF2007 domain-containing protein [Bdellovibrionales bacterium]|nr:DUF2007 domain-containing protein [Bdellovibrionales bacterium]
MSRSHLIEIGDFASLPEAEIAKSLLESHGISAFMAVPSGGATPELGFSDGYRLRVAAADFDDAKQILQKSHLYAVED